MTAKEILALAQAHRSEPSLVNYQALADAVKVMERERDEAIAAARSEVAAAEKRGREQREAELMAVGMEPFGDWPEYNANAMGCGLEDYGLQTQPYEAMEYGWNDYDQRVLELGPFYTAEKLAAARLQGAEEARARILNMTLPELASDGWLNAGKASAVNQGLLDALKAVLQWIDDQCETTGFEVIEAQADAAIAAAEAHTGEQT